MASNKVLDISDILDPDHIACRIADHWLKWDQFREQKKAEWAEVRDYIFATDTTKTGNAKLPWSNKTTIPKLCQIRDNLHANYMAALFPRRKNLEWIGDNEKDNSRQKKEVIESYMTWATDRNEHYSTVSKLVYDYIDYGNVFAFPDWEDNTIQTPQGTTKVGYVGPTLSRVSPYDIVFDPTASSFTKAPKIVRSYTNLGELKLLLEKEGVSSEDKAEAQRLWDYLKGVRENASAHTGEFTYKDRAYAVDGFTSFRDYLCGDIVEVLTFYGDMYDSESDELLRNYVIKIVDRHKVISKRPNESIFGECPIRHVGWRPRNDNLWAMGPLDNLIGMQYRIDHLENMKADVFDLIAYPPLKVKGYVDDFTWGPFERIYTDENGDVELMSPDVQALNADNQIALLEMKMEEMAGAPREAMGFRTPGEKTAFEVQRIENAASRLFSMKAVQFERDFLEPLYTGQLELSRRMAGPTLVRVFDDELHINVFLSLTPQDLAGVGQIRPIGARTFADKAMQIQNITNFYSSAVGQDELVKSHMSSLAVAKLFEDLLDLNHHKIVQPFIRLSEQADAQRLMNSSEEQVMMEAQTPAGITPGDHDIEATFQDTPSVDQMDQEFTGVGEGTV